MRNIIISTFALLAACGTSSEEISSNYVSPSGEEFVVEGEVPEGADMNALMASMGDHQFGVVFDPVSGEGAVIQRAHDSAARIVGDRDFNQVGPLVCLDCGTGCSGSASRTVEIPLEQDDGANFSTFAIQTFAGTTDNFNLVSAGIADVPGVVGSTQETWTGDVGENFSVQVGGITNSCGVASYFMDFEASARVFVTSTTVTPGVDFTGTAGADAFCQTRADAAGLGGDWAAWLADSSSPATSSLGLGGPWVVIEADILAPGTSSNLIANDQGELTDGQISAPINTDEFGTGITGTVSVHTGANGDGTAASDNCDNWTNGTAAFQSTRGSSEATNLNDWTNFDVPVDCDVPAHLYCFEQ